MPSIPSTILVVEDEVLIRTLIVETLRDEGFHVIEAANADEALTYLSVSNHVDLVFTDIDMTGSMNGIELAQHVLENIPRLKVIFTSGGAKGGDIGTLGSFLPKPFLLGAVVTMIRTAIGPSAA